MEFFLYDDRQTKIIVYAKKSHKSGDQWKKKPELDNLNVYSINSIIIISVSRVFIHWLRHLCEIN